LIDFIGKHEEVLVLFSSLFNLIVFESTDNIFH